MATWGIGYLFDKTAAEVKTPETVYHQQLGQGIANLMNSSNRPDEVLDSLSDGDIQFSVSSMSALNLPVELQEQFQKDRFLSLASSNEITDLFPLDNQQVLTITRGVTVASNQLGLQFIFTVLFYIAIAAVLLLWSRPLISRLIKLRQTTRAFGEGDLSRRIEEGSNIYIGDIEREFNRMADHIETLIADNKLLSSAVSHDLKTPLARLRFGVDVLQDATTDKQRDRYLKKISGDLLEMEKLVDTLLCYARLDQAKLELSRDNIDLVQFINELSASFSDSHIRLDWQPEQEPVYVQGDKRYLSLLINNLISNASQYAQQCVSIRIEKNRDSIKLLVEDDGPGIPLQQRQAVLKPFVRGEAERSSPGHGMGLAIVNRIIHWHRWGLSIGESKQLGGAQVEVTIA